MTIGRMTSVTGARRLPRKPVSSGLIASLVTLGAFGSAYAQTGDDGAMSSTATTTAQPSVTPASQPASLPSVAPAAPPPPESEPAADPDSAPTEAPAAEAMPEEAVPELEEIYVTSQKRRQNQQKVPLSVMTMNGTQASLLRASGADIRFLSARVPSLTIESSFGRTFPRFYIRGLGNTDFDLNASQPVSMILDDVVLENPTLKGFPIFDLDRVEVLRGPQGTLFGRNTPAGIIKFQSRAPTFDFEGYGRATYGSFGFVSLESAISGPIIEDVLAVRLSVLYERRDGWVDNTFTGEEGALEGFEDVAGRFQILYTPNEKFSLLVNMHAHSLRGTARLFRANIVEPRTDVFVDGFERDQGFESTAPTPSLSTSSG